MLPAVVLGCSTLATGCLVAEAPEYGPPQQRPPVIDTQKVDPPPYELQVFFDRSERMTIDVPFRSEDAGENLVGALYLDWAGRRDETQFLDKTLPASTFDRVDRKFSTEWFPDSRVKENCGHTLTLLILHESNYDDPYPKERVEWDIASVTWQLNVLPKNDDPTIIQVCPRSGDSTN